MTELSWTRDWPSYWLSSRWDAQTLTFEDAARSQCSFHLQAVDGVALAPFLPGQYLTFSLKLADGVVAPPAGVRAITRCDSLSDRPDPAGYRITVKRALAPANRPELPPGLSSSHFHDQVHEGDVLQGKAQAGHFFIDPNASVPAVFIAGGIDITPMMSMLRWCIEEQPGRPVHPYHGVRSSADHAFKRVLQDLAAAHPAFKLNVVSSSPSAMSIWRCCAAPCPMAATSSTSAGRHR